MKAFLYRYSHPYDSNRFIYCGQTQSTTRDKRHRKGYDGFGKRFKKKFPDIELPQPIIEEVNVVDHLELNWLEIEWMFRYHTWHAYPDGMNLSIPGSHDYKNIQAMAVAVRSNLPFEKQSEIMKRVSAGMSKEERSQAGKDRMSSPEIRARYSERISQIALSKPVEERVALARKISSGMSRSQRIELGVKNVKYLPMMSMTPEQRSEWCKKRDAALTPQELSERGRKRWASLTPTQRSEIASKRQENISPERRSEIANKRNAGMTPEQWAKRTHTRLHIKNWKGRWGVSAPKPSPRCDFCIDEGLIVAF